MFLIECFHVTSWQPWWCPHVSSRNWTLFLCYCFLLVCLKNMLIDTLYWVKTLYELPLSYYNNYYQDKTCVFPVDPWKWSTNELWSILFLFWMKLWIIISVYFLSKYCYWFWCLVMMIMMMMVMMMMMMMMMMLWWWWWLCYDDDDDRDGDVMMMMWWR